jgi:hypothetical protein
MEQDPDPIDICQRPIVQPGRRKEKPSEPRIKSSGSGSASKNYKIQDPNLGTKKNGIGKIPPTFRTNSRKAPVFGALSKVGKLEGINKKIPGVPKSG